MMRRPGGSAALVLTGLFCSGCSQVVWRGSLSGALDESARDGRMVVVWYWHPLNRDCKEMERTVFRTDEVIAQMEATIPVRLHADFSRRWAAENGITDVPTFVAVAPGGTVLRRRDGAMDADQFLAFLQVARLSP